MVWTNIINDPCDGSSPNDAVPVMDNFNYRLGNLLPMNDVNPWITDYIGSTYDLGSALYPWKDLYLSGGINMGAATKVGAHLSGSQGMSDGNWTTVVFDVEDFDSLSEYDDATGIFTATATGYYDVNVCLTFETVFGTREGIGVSVWKNGSKLAQAMNVMLPPAQLSFDGWSQDVTCIVYLEVADTIEIKGYCKHVNVSIWAGSYVNITKKVF